MSSGVHLNILVFILFNKRKTNLKPLLDCKESYTTQYNKILRKCYINVNKMNSHLMLLVFIYNINHC